MYETYASYYDNYENDFINTEKALLKAVELGNSQDHNSLKENLIDIYKSTSSFYEKYDKPVLALKYLKLFNNLQQEVIEEKENEILDGKDKTLQLDKINQHVVKVEEANKSYLKQLNYNKLFILFLIGLLFTIITLLYLLNKNYKKNKKINKLLKKANTQLFIAKQKTEEIAKLKSQFLSTVSHELRTPLYGVIGLSEIIENEHLELKDSKYLKSLKFSAKYLLTLINDVLNLSKIEAGHLKLNFESTNIRYEMETLVNSMEVIANQYHNIITLDINDNVPKFIKTDKIRLSQIIINLLSNSLKFTKQGVVKLIIEANNDFLEVQIIDNGIGIPKKYINKIFDDFVQIELNSGEDFQGTGLGLAIVKKFITLFNGTISVDSTVNIGTSIKFVIPLEVVEEMNQYKEPLEIFSEIYKNLKILVVEDNKVNQIVTQKLLENNGLSCEIAEDGYEALKKVKSSTYDIILMDIHMPGINGFETTEQIKALGIITPIIALTASDKYEIADDITTYKMNDILIKPFEIEDLKVIIRNNVS
jgi:signal transduction histidine kinase